VSTSRFWPAITTYSLVVAGYVLVQARGQSTIVGVGESLGAATFIWQGLTGLYVQQGQMGELLAPGHLGHANSLG